MSGRIAEEGRSGDSTRQRSNRSQVSPSSLGASSAYDSCATCGQRGFACRCVLATMSSYESSNANAEAHLPPKTRSETAVSDYTPSAPRPSQLVGSPQHPHADLEAEDAEGALGGQQRLGVGRASERGTPPARPPPPHPRTPPQARANPPDARASGANPPGGVGEEGRGAFEPAPLEARYARCTNCGRELVRCACSFDAHSPPAPPRPAARPPPPPPAARDGGTLIRMRVRIPHPGGDAAVAARGLHGVPPDELAAANKAYGSAPAGGLGPPQRPPPASPPGSGGLPFGYDGELGGEMTAKEREIEMLNREAAGAVVRLEEQQEELERMRRRDTSLAACTETPPPEIMCPIACDIMRDPVICTDGHTYERSAIEMWLTRRASSPMTNQLLARPVVLIPNHALRSIIAGFVERQGGWDALMGDT